ncbi:MAG: tryptophan synthase subunit alpha [Lentisphaerae bacterium]|nr:tryptophan synthase subunit alpha [Lentisphaerota bacterium]
MSERIDAVFRQLAKDGRKGFIAYITAGDPTVERTVEDVLRLAAAGTDLVELGVPFSDPLADGRVNVESAGRALKGGATLARVLDGVRAVRRRSGVPIVLYSYLNPLLARGFEATVRRIAAAGVDGVLILDMAVEEAPSFAPAMRAAGVAPILLVTPTSTAARMKRIAAEAAGFVYCVSRTGVTGARKDLSTDAGDVLARMRRATRLPLALGFGISTPGQAAAAAAAADAVVVGSALVDRLHGAGGDAKARAAVFAWVARMARAAHGAGA